MLAAQMQYIRNIGTLALAVVGGALSLSGCFLVGDGQMQPGAVDTTPDAFRPFDGGTVDAFVPLTDAEPPVDAGPMDADTPGDDGGVPMDAVVPMDAGPPDSGPPDAGPPDTGPPDTGPPDTGPPDTGPPDTGPPDTGPPPLRTCDDLYDDIPGVSVCSGGTATRCRLFYSSSDNDCEDVCGTACVESFNNGTGCLSAGGSTSCDTNRNTQICICDRVP